MENMDAEKAARVWQRVQAGHGSDPEELMTLAALERSDAAVYLQLSHRFQGEEAALLRRLYRQKLSRAACLRGMYQLRTGNRLSSAPVKGQPLQNTQAALRRCYGREMQSLAACEARSHDPEYGPVFGDLARQGRTHCQLLLTLIGTLTEQ